MLKVELDTGLAVKVTNKLGYSEFLPKSQIRLSEDGKYVVAAKSWIIEKKELDASKLIVDETIGMKMQKLNETECMVFVNGKSYKRNYYLYKTRNIHTFYFKNGIFAVEYNNEKTHFDEEDIQFVGTKKDGFKDSDIEEMLKQKEAVEEVKVKIEKELEEPDWTKPTKHMQYEIIKACIKSDIPVYLYGPAGSGKNHTLQQIAEELGLEFYFTNSVQQEFKITGFIDAGGKYHETEFYKVFTQGGLFFLDEMDASIPEVLVLLNAAIANGYFEFPNGKEFADPNFRVVAAGNTIGSGADEQYTGRLVLDQATLDRFVSIEFDYDRNIELHLAKGNTELVDFIRKLREKAKETGIRMTFSYRAITNVTKLEQIGMDLKTILLIAVLKGLDKDTCNTLVERYSDNKYFRVMATI